MTDDRHIAPSDPGLTDARRSDAAPAEPGHLDVNRANWDDRTDIHVASDFYDVEGWLADLPGPRPREIAALGDVRGLDLVHLQCHFGMDTLPFARAGATVTGLDLSPRAVEEARRLAERAGLADRATFVEGDVLDAAHVLAPSTFDIVYVSLGALTWLPSVDRWAAQVAGLLRRGGRLYLHDGHPLAWAMAGDDLTITDTYFEEPEPYVEESAVTYTDADRPITATVTHEWNHSIGETVTALIDHGLVIDRLTEHDWTVFEQWPWLVEEPRTHRSDDRIYRLPPDRPRVPLTFTVLAHRPG